MALLSKAQITTADDRTFENVDVPEWGGTVRLVALSGTDRDAYEASFVRYGPTGKVIGRDMKDVRARLVARSLVDEDGKRLFTDAEAAALGKKNGAVIDRLFDVAKRLSGISADEVEAKAGNSEPGPSAGSTSV